MEEHYNILKPRPVPQGVVDKYKSDYETIQLDLDRFLLADFTLGEFRAFRTLEHRIRTEGIDYDSLEKLRGIRDAVRKRAMRRPH